MLPQIYSRFSFTTFPKHSSVSHFVPGCSLLLSVYSCSSSFYVQFDKRSTVLLVSVHMPLIRAGDLMTAWPDWFFWPVPSWILCFLSAFWWRRAVFQQRIKLSTEHKPKWGTCSLLFPLCQTLICVSHFLAATSLISASPIERNNSYFDILAITLWRQLYKQCLSCPSVTAQFCVTDSGAERCVGW